MKEKEKLRGGGLAENGQKENLPVTPCTVRKKAAARSTACGARIVHPKLLRLTKAQIATKGSVETLEVVVGGWWLVVGWVWFWAKSNREPTDAGGSAGSDEGGV